MEPDPRNHPELAAEFPGVILEEDTPGHVSYVETKTLDPNDIVAASSANSGITNTTGVYNDSDAPTPVFTNQTNT